MRLIYILDAGVCGRVMVSSTGRWARLMAPERRQQVFPVFSSCGGFSFARPVDTSARVVAYLRDGRGVCCREVGCCMRFRNPRRRCLRLSSGPSRQTVQPGTRRNVPRFTAGSGYMVTKLPM